MINRLWPRAENKGDVRASVEIVIVSLMPPGGSTGQFFMYPPTHEYSLYIINMFLHQKSEKPFPLFFLGGFALIIGCGGFFLFCAATFLRYKHAFAFWCRD